MNREIPRERQRHSRVWWLEQQRLYESSGKTVREYCEEAGLPVTTFCRWRRNLGLVGGYNREISSKSEVKFIELSPPKVSLSEPIQIELPSGIILRVSADTPAVRVKELAAACFVMGGEQC
jgi:hypothetical protein